MKRTLNGTILALACTAGLVAVMLPLRGSLSIATTALILVVPVVIGVVAGGFAVGIISVLAGFLVYDFFFIPPYLTLWVGAPQNWAALGVYGVVMLPVAKVVAVMDTAREKELRQGRELRELFVLSDLLVEDKPLDALLPALVTALSEAFAARQVALFLPGPAGEPAKLAASAGVPLSAAQLDHVLPAPGATAGIGTQPPSDDALTVIALTASGRPVGLLALSAAATARHEREPLLLFGNHIALAVERAQLREQAMRTRVDAEMARVARTLVAAVAHDLRAPLASLKASSSTLADSELDISADARRGLAVTIDAKADQLADLVQNLLDMSRIQAGVLLPRHTVASLGALVTSVVSDPPPSWHGHEITAEIPDSLPPFDADQVLMTRVLTNLIDNAIRHSPDDGRVAIRAVYRPGTRASEAGTIKVSVTDHGPGVPVARREEIFGLFPRREHDAGAGLGLTIARTFVEAHGQRIWVEDAPEGGARFCFTVPAAAEIEQEPRLAASSHH
jgi:two-component system, OmpR family, sensor histidine kinase KdpD